jgi:hypothetical protein
VGISARKFFNVVSLFVSFFNDVSFIREIQTTTLLNFGR